MHLSIKKYNLLILFSLVLFSCENSSTEIAQDETAFEEQVASEPVNFHDQDTQVISCNGKVDVPPQFRADVHAKTDGFVENITVLVGQRVKKGDVLATLTSQEFILLQDNLLQSKAKYEQLQKDHARKSELSKSNAVSEKELERVNAELLQSKAAFLAFAEQAKFVGINLDKILKGDVSNRVSIIAPIDGFVNKAQANNGKHVTANELLFQIVDESHKHVELAVFSSDAQKLQKSQLVKFRANGSKTIFEGSVFLINQALDDQLQYVNVHVHPIDEQLPLMVSSYVEATIYIDSLLSVKDEKH